jgi:hypothetical protein
VSFHKAKLISYGFSSAASLAEGLASSLEMVASQLPRQPHYAFDLRTIVAVIDLAVVKFTKEKETGEGCAVAAALREVAAPRLSAEDLARLDELLPLFLPSPRPGAPGAGEMAALQDTGLVPSGEMLDKVLCLLLLPLLPRWRPSGRRWTVIPGPS